MTRKFQPLKPRNSVCTPRCGYFQKNVPFLKKEIFHLLVSCIIENLIENVWREEGSECSLLWVAAILTTQQRAVRTRMRTHFINKKRHFLTIWESHSLFTSSSDVGGCVKVGTWAFFINTSTATTADEIMFHTGGIFVCWSWTLGADRLQGITNIDNFATHHKRRGDRSLQDIIEIFTSHILERQNTYLKYCSIFVFSCCQ